MSPFLADRVLGLTLLAACLWWLVAGWRRGSRTIDAGLALLDAPTRARHPSSRPAAPAVLTTDCTEAADPRDAAGRATP
jgi:hypothetical protein